MANVEEAQVKDDDVQAAFAPASPEVHDAFGARDEKGVPLAAVSTQGDESAQSEDSAHTEAPVSAAEATKDSEA
ncbi:MAG: hypothetical protein HIU81_12215, partial [Acidobacteria bacterium]|nr:hypothetical protein [Acidobacteriota bacterium]